MQPGQTNNPNGRPKGVPNKRNQEIYELAEELGCNPVKVLMHFAMGDFEALGYDQFQQKVVGKGKDQQTIEELTISPELRKSAASDLMPYMYAKRKPVDSNGDDSTSVFDEILSAIDGTK